MSDDQRRLVFLMFSLHASVVKSALFFLEKLQYETKWSLILSLTPSDSLEDSSADASRQRTKRFHKVAPTRVWRKTPSRQRVAQPGVSTICGATGPDKTPKNLERQRVLYVTVDAPRDKIPSRQSSADNLLTIVGASTWSLDNRRPDTPPRRSSASFARVA
jgi:hypothetical protein